MNFFGVYILRRLLYRVASFFRHWYVKSFLNVVRRTIGLLERLDRRLALRITARYWLKPLYQDYSLLGYAFGFLFRSVRVVVVLVIYLCIILGAVGVYAVWAAIPAALLYKVLNS